MSDRPNINYINNFHENHVEDSVITEIARKSKNTVNITDCIQQFKDLFRKQVFPNNFGYKRKRPTTPVCSFKCL